jgi:hypothetical protein
MNVKKILMVVFAVLMAGMATSASAHGPRTRLGVHIGGPVWGPVWYPPPYYYPPQVIVLPPAQPPVYIEQQDAAPAAQQYWYYCTSAKGYYPYVKDCPDGWQKILPQPEK